jgi:hypothetical protein
MAFTFLDVQAGQVDLYNVDTLGPGPLVGLAGSQPTTRGFTNYPGTIMRAFDPFLGAAEFIYGKANGAITYGAAVQWGTSVTAGRTDITMTPWAGTAVTGMQLGVALQTLATGNYGWFQVGGVAIATVSGAPAVGNPAYWQATGVVAPTVVASKQMVNAQFASAAAAVIGTGSPSLVAYAPGNTGGTLSATQALVALNRPFAQGAIT